jgi:hypothetical protein
MKLEVVWNVQTDEVLERRMASETAAQRPALLVVHDEDEVRPLEHTGVHPCEGIRGRSGRSHVEVGTFAEHAFRGRTAHAIVPAQEQDAFR